MNARPTQPRPGAVPFLVLALVLAASAPLRAAPVVLAVPSAGHGNLVHVTATGTPGDRQVAELSSDLGGWFRFATVAFDAGGKASLYVPGADAASRLFRLRPFAPGEAPAPLAFVAPPDGTFSSESYVGQDGGTLSLVDGSGTRFDLEIPAGALAAGETVTLRALGPTSGWPLAGGLVAGVRLDPEGAVLARPARLTVTPATPPGPGPFAGVAWHGTGAELQARAVSAGPAAFTLAVGRLGGFGVATLGAGDAAAFKAHPPTDFAEQLLHDQALLQQGVGTASAAASRRAASPAGLSPAALAHVRLIYATHIRPALVEAATDDSLVDHALATYGIWNLSLDLMYAAADLADVRSIRDEAAQLGADALIAGIERNVARCDAHELKALGRIVHFGQMLENDPWASGAGPVTRDVVRQQVKNCATFDLDLDSQADTTTSLGTVQSRVHTHWTIRFPDEALTRLSGGGPVPMEATQSLSVPAPCSVTGPVPVPGSCQIPEFTLVPGLRDLLSLTNEPGPARMAVLINPFLLPPAEGIFLHCPFAGAVPFQGYWTTAFGERYAGDLVTVPQGQIFRVTGWTPVGGEVLGRRDDTVTVAQGQFTIQMTLHWTLRHVPVPFH